MKRFLFAVFFFFYFSSIAFSQYWQQRVKYSMDIDMNVVTNRFTGKLKLEYTNNSPDTLYKVFYHLYWNAFQPNSMMDTRSRELGKIRIGGRADWDGRVRDRISKLKDDEIGYQKVLSLKMNGVAQKYIVHETILEVPLSKPIAPKAKAVFDMDFEAQVPLQIRRSGRDNPQTGIRYSMSQWYPKICEYDFEGWHPVPYVGREFFGVWGDYDVKITIDKTYILGGSGYLQNASQIGYGYETPGAKVVRPAGDKLTWIFSAPNVHDFMWAADPQFIHVSKVMRKDLVMHVLYKSTERKPEAWEGILNTMQNALPYIEKTFGPYPYKQYSFVQGGDGGMEYPMATLLSTTGGAMHEFMHSWYQGILASNEAEHPWMDEGFTEYADTRVYAYLGNKDTGFVQKPQYDGYFDLVKRELQEPLTTFDDHYNTNYTHFGSTYSKGGVFIEQLGYVIGADVRDKVLLEYYRQWRFKHPSPNDFIRVAEKVSGIQLDWYKEYFINTTKTIDYSIDSLWEEGGKSKIRLRRMGQMPMPIDLMLTFKDGSKELHYIPMNLMFASKAAEDKTTRVVHEEWRWTHPTYVVEFDKRLLDVISVEIDPSQRMADTDRKNNLLELKW